MTLRPLGANQTEVTINDELVILFSYRTPVACSVVLDGKWQHFKTEKQWSVTTSRHVNKWMPTATGTKAQEWFDALASNLQIVGVK
jgi:hypothetical protein